MTEISGGELLVRCLAREGVRCLIGITDEGYHPIQHTCADYGIRHIAPRHEAAGAHIAQGIYKSSGEISAVLGGGGPGAANLVSGILCAQAEGVPMIVITGQRRKQVVYPSRVGIYQGADQLDWFRPCTNWNAVVHDWERIPEIVARAFREALSGRPGPVHIDVPQTVMNEKRDEDSVLVLDPAAYRSLEPAEPSRSEIEELATLLVDAENPLVIAGTGILNAAAWDDLAELLDLLGCPVVPSMAGRTALPDAHPSNLFPFSEGAQAARREADVVLALGTCLGETELPFDKHWGDASQKLVQVDIDARNLGAHRRLHRGIVADAGATMRALVARLRELGAQPSDGERARAYREMAQEWLATTRSQFSDSFSDDCIHPAQSVLAAREVFPADAIDVADGGNTHLFNLFFSSFSEPRSFLGLFEFGHLGTGIPSAIGAKLANPERDVYCITGDGAAGFNIMEMETALREKVKITVIVHAEGSWCMEEILHLMEGAPPDRYESVVQTDVRWDKLAEAIGCHGEYVEKPADLVNAFRAARDSDLPALVCVRTDRKANLIPPLAQGFAEVYNGPDAT